MKRSIFILTLLFALSISFAQMANINTAIGQLYWFLSEVMPILTMLMVVGAGAVYAGGQIMGAETRARANVWATGMVIGALIGILITVLGPFVMSTMYGDDWNITIGMQPGMCNPNPCSGSSNLCCSAGSGYACYSSTQVCCTSGTYQWICAGPTALLPNQGCDPTPSNPPLSDDCCTNTIGPICQAPG